MKNANARVEALGLDDLELVVGGADRILTPPPNPLGISNASVLAGRNAFAADAAEHGGSVGVYLGYGTNVLGNGPSTVMTVGTDLVHFYDVGSKGFGNGASSGGLVGVWAATSPNGSAYWTGPGHAGNVGLKAGGSASLDFGYNGSGANLGVSIGPGAAVGGVAASVSSTFGTEIHPFGQAAGAPAAPGDHSFDARWNSDMNALGSNNTAGDHSFDARWNSDMNALGSNNAAGDHSFDARWNSDMNALGSNTLPASVQSEFGLSPSGQPLGIDHSNGANPFDAVPPAPAPDPGHPGGDGGTHSDAGTGTMTVAANDIHVDTGHVDDSVSHGPDPTTSTVSAPVIDTPPPVIDTPPPVIDIPAPVWTPPISVTSPDPVVASYSDVDPIPVVAPTNPIVDTSSSFDMAGGFDPGSFDPGSFDTGSFDTGGFDGGGFA